MVYRCSAKPLDATREAENGRCACGTTATDLLAPHESATPHESPRVPAADLRFDPASCSFERRCGPAVSKAVHDGVDDGWCASQARQVETRGAHRSGGRRHRSTLPLHGAWQKGLVMCGVAVTERV